MAKTKNLLFVVLAALMMTGSIIITGCSSSDLPAYTYGLNYEHSGTIFVPAVQQDFEYSIKVAHNTVKLTFMGLDFVFPMYNEVGECKLKTDGNSRYVEVFVGNDLVKVPVE